MDFPCFVFSKVVFGYFRYEILDRERMTAVEALTKEKEQLKINTHVRGCLDGELKKERGKRENLEKSLEEEKEKINSIKEENAQLKVIANVSHDLLKAR